jgi:hypothetical protein
MQKNSLILILLSVICSTTFGQDIRLVASASEKGVELKWFYKDLIAPEGVNLYEQKSGGNWTKINQKPIKKGDYTPSTQELNQDKDLKKHLDLVSSSKKLESFGLLLATMKAIKSSVYAKHLGMYYFVNTPLSGSENKYKVTLIKNGQEIQFSEVSVNSSNETKSKVKDIAYDQRFKKVNFNWNPSADDFFAFNVYRSTSKDSLGTLITKDPIILSKVKNEKGIEDYPKWFFEDRLVREKNSYYYRFVGVDFFYCEQEISEPILIRIKDETVPLAPKLISKTEQKEGFTINWELDYIDEDVQSIALFLSGRNDTLLKKVENIKIDKNAKVYDLKLPKFGTYLVKVATEDQEGNFGLSNEFVLDFLDKIPPLKPANVRIEKDSNKLKIVWDKNQEDDLLGYKIYRGINGVKNSMALQNATPFTANEYVDLLPKNAKNSFTYCVMALDSVLNESELSALISEKLIDVVPPKAPFIKSVEITEKGAQLIWVKNTETDLYKYEVFRKNVSDSSKTFEKVNLTLIDRTTDAFLDRSFQEGKVYEYIVYAFDSLENKSQASNVYKALKVVKPKDLTFECQLKQPKFSKAANSVKLSWDIKPYYDEVKYVVFRKEGESAFVPMNSVGTNNRFTDAKIEKGKRYVYEIRCYYEDGKIIKSEQVEIEIKENKRK